jgi:hypothetical protein
MPKTRSAKSHPRKQGWNLEWVHLSYNIYIGKVDTMWISLSSHSPNWPVVQNFTQINPFPAEVAIMRLLGSVPKSHLCDQRRRSKVTGMSDLMTIFIDLECLYCKQTQRAFNVFKNTLSWLKIDSLDQKFNWLECGNFSQDAGTPGTERVIAFSQLAVKGLKSLYYVNWTMLQFTN